MEALKVLEKQYSVMVDLFQDAEDRPRRELQITLTIVYETPGNRRDERGLHFTWYSHPDPQKYNRWDFDHITISSLSREILSEAFLLTEIRTMDEEIQPHEFELRLQALGFSRKGGTPENRTYGGKDTEK